MRKPGVLRVVGAESELGEPLCGAVLLRGNTREGATVVAICEELRHDGRTMHRRWIALDIDSGRPGDTMALAALVTWSDPRV